MTHKRFAGVALGVLAFNQAVILWGAMVRATGSGAGCGNHWPTCNGEVIPQSPSVHTLIEYAHRVSSGLSLLLVAALGVLAFRAFPPGSAVRKAAAAAAVFILTEAALGAGLVLLHLVADNATTARAAAMALHLVNTYLLLASLLLAAWWAWTGQSTLPARPAPDVYLVVLGVLGLVLLGMSGAVAALGDTLFPSRSMEEALAADLSPTSHLLLRLRLFHPVIAAGVAFYLVACVLWLERFRATPRGRLLSGAVLVAVALQVAAGGANVLLLAPPWMQVVHLLLADVGWMAFILAGSTALDAPGSAGGKRSPQAA